MTCSHNICVETVYGCTCTACGEVIDSYPQLVETRQVPISHLKTLHLDQGVLQIYARESLVDPVGTGWRGSRQLRHLSLRWQEKREGRWHGICQMPEVYWVRHLQYAVDQCYPNLAPGKRFFLHRAFCRLVRQHPGPYATQRRAYSLALIYQDLVRTGRYDLGPDQLFHLCVIDLLPGGQGETALLHAYHRELAKLPQPDRKMILIQCTRYLFLRYNLQTPQTLTQKRLMNQLLRQAYESAYIWRHAAVLAFLAYVWSQGICLRNVDEAYHLVGLGINRTAGSWALRCGIRPVICRNTGVCPQ